MGAFMTIHTAGGGLSIRLVRFCMITVLVGFLRVSMALGTCDLCGGRLVRRRLYIFMTINTGKHAAMDGMAELVGIDIQADRLASNLLCQAGVGVAG